MYQQTSPQLSLPMLAGRRKLVPCIQKAQNSLSARSSFSLLLILLGKQKKKKLSSLEMPFAFNTRITKAGLKKHYIFANGNEEEK